MCVFIDVPPGATAPTKVGFVKAFVASCSAVGCFLHRLHSVNIYFDEEVKYRIFCALTHTHMHSWHTDVVVQSEWLQAPCERCRRRILAWCWYCLLNSKFPFSTLLPLCHASWRHISIPFQCKYSHYFVRVPPMMAGVGDSSDYAVDTFSQATLGTKSTVLTSRSSSRRSPVNSYQSCDENAQPPVQAAEISVAEGDQTV